ncbi:MAG: hypothetical protein Q9217_000604 [Psora testacea]
MDSSIQTRPNPLGFMDRLTSTTYMSQPENFTATTLTIILLTWMKAASTHIAFYLQKYRQMYPCARLMLIRGTVPNMTYLPNSMQKRNMAPIPSAIRANPASPTFLHLFSNSGAQSTCTLLRAYKETSATHREQMPSKAMFFDSTPSSDTYSSGYAGLAYEVLRFAGWLQPLGLVLVHFLVSVMWLVGRILWWPNVLTRSIVDLNEPTLVPKDAPRVYFYSKEDLLVKWQDVEGHAAVEAKKCWKVTEEVFPGTGHCRL